MRFEKLVLRLLLIIIRLVSFNISKEHAFEHLTDETLNKLDFLERQTKDYIKDD